MSEINAVKGNLHKASYFYTECAVKLELAQEDAQKASGLLGSMTSLLLEMHAKRSTALETSQKNVDRSNTAMTSLETALGILWSISEEIPSSEELSRPLLRAYESLEHIQRILGYATQVLEKEAPYAIQQVTEIDTSLKGAAGQNSEAQQHFTDTAMACTEYVKNL